MKSVSGSLLATIGLMSDSPPPPAFGRQFARAGRPTPRRRSRYAGEPVAPGGKLARKAAEGRLSIATIR